VHAPANGPGSSYTVSVFSANLSAPASAVSAGTVSEMCIHSSDSVVFDMFGSQRKNPRICRLEPHLVQAAVASQLRIPSLTPGQTGIERIPPLLRNCGVPGERAGSVKGASAAKRTLDPHKRSHRMNHRSDGRPREGTFATDDAQLR